MHNVHDQSYLMKEKSLPIYWKTRFYTVRKVVTNLLGNPFLHCEKSRYQSTRKLGYPVYQTLFQDLFIAFYLKVQLQVILAK